VLPAEIPGSGCGSDESDSVMLVSMLAQTYTLEKVNPYIM
jgi:hypothetical protein